MPHSAFRGQTPDEVYFAIGAEIPAKLAAAHRAALVARVGANRALQCATCIPEPCAAVPPALWNRQSFPTRCNCTRRAPEGLDSQQCAASTKVSRT
jgi:hypothetical protein